MTSMITVTEQTMRKLPNVSGTSTTTFWKCWRSVLPRLISSPVALASWNEKWRRWMWAKMRSRSFASMIRALRNAR